MGIKFLNILNHFVGKQIIKHVIFITEEEPEEQIKESDIVEDFYYTESITLFNASGNNSSQGTNYCNTNMHVFDCLFR